MALRSPQYDILIIGAGAAGLQLMHELISWGYRVAILEAGKRAGGRIATLREKGFDHPLESGAEFIHGNLAQTNKLLRKAKLDKQETGGKMIGVKKGEWDKQEEHDDHWGLMMKRLHQLKKDMSIRDFLVEYFPEEKYRGLRDAARRFAEGFDLADISKASILSVKKEWAQADGRQYRIPGGYGQLIDYLMRECRRGGGKIFFNTRVTRIRHKRNDISVETISGRVFRARKLAVTASLGVLQKEEIEFTPRLTTHAQAIRQLGFGQVIKFFLQFKTAFWKEQAEDAGFLLTDQVIPTWWTQLPVESRVLTGWLGGPRAERRSKDPDSKLLQSALQSLSRIFHKPVSALKKDLKTYRIYRWSENGFCGGYSYSTVFSEKAIEILAEPFEDTLFFAGEAIHSGETRGTVEAALQSGLVTAKKIKKAMRS